MITNRLLEQSIKGESISFDQLMDFTNNENSINFVDTNTKTNETVSLTSQLKATKIKRQKKMPTSNDHHRKPSTRKRRQIISTEAARK